MGSRGSWLRRLFAPPPVRPPGALPEERFAALCIRCGRCVAACPHRAIRPADASHGVDAGTPMIATAEAPCYLCMACPPVCPTGALDRSLREPRAVRMGKARIVERHCFAHQGILCRTCVDECPFEGEAIRLDDDMRPVVTDKCVGCGLCEARCPAPDVAIVIDPAGRTA